MPRLCVFHPPLCYILFTQSRPAARPPPPPKRPLSIHWGTLAGVKAWFYSMTLSTPSGAHDYPRNRGIRTGTLRPHEPSFLIAAPCHLSWLSGRHVLDFHLDFCLPVVSSCFLPQFREDSGPGKDSCLLLHLVEM